jgi:hypothetical protein
MEVQSGRGSCRASILAVQGVLNAPDGAEKHFERAFRHRSYRNVRAKRELLPFIEIAAPSQPGRGIQPPAPCLKNLLLREHAMIRTAFASVHLE